nr:hypothetical protein BaRGS_028692 [Batillaria attramentaria]
MVHWFEQQIVKSRTKRDFRAEVPKQDFKLKDPYYKQQWYLHGGGHGNFDMNVIPAWQKGYTGKNIVVTILDDGIERTHPDLIKNYGREGKGSIFVWASGNGGSAQDSCNCDGYANSIYTLSISSTSEHGTKPWYLEECSSTLATTYSSGAYNEKQIVTVDLHDRCTVSHTGTSASAPLAAGIVALILEANPNLTWRDVQYITLMTSRPEPMVDGQWVTNAQGRKVSLRYGYGLMDASRMVDLALVWRNVPEKRICLVASHDSNQNLSGDRHTTSVITDGCMGEQTEVRFLEHVQCRVTLHYAPRGAIAIHLTSPQGTRSTILPHRPNDMSSQGFNDWPLLSVHFWGEDPRGEWTLEIEHGASGYTRQLNGGVLVSWSLVLHGTKENPVAMHLRNQTQSPTTAAPVQTSASTVNKSTTTSALKPTIPLEQCDQECEGACTGTGPSHCQACKHFTNLTDGTCVAACPNGTYVHEKTCKECDAACRTCSGPTLMECLTCYEGVKFHPKHGTCYEECLPGTYSDIAHCLPCHKDCKECSGPGKADCTACKGEEDKLVHGSCYSGRSWFSRMQGSLQGVVLGMVLLCSLLLMVIGMVVLLLAHRQRKLCWSYKYDKLPCHDGDEEDAQVSLTYDDTYKT